MSLGWLFKVTKPYTNSHWHSFVQRDDLGTQTSEASYRDNGSRFWFGSLCNALMLCSNTTKAKYLKNKDDVGGAGCLTQSLISFQTQSNFFLLRESLLNGTTCYSLNTGCQAKQYGKVPSLDCSRKADRSSVMTMAFKWSPPTSCALAGSPGKLCQWVSLLSTSVLAKQHK